MLRIGVDARPLTWLGSSGVQRVTSNIVRELWLHSDVELYLYTCSRLGDVPERQRVRELGSSPGAFVVSLPLALRRDGCDVFLGTGSAAFAGRCPAALMIHDDYSAVIRSVLSPAERRTRHYVLVQSANKLKLAAATKAQALIFGSNFARRSVTSRFSGRKTRTEVVVYWGTDPALAATADVDAFRAEVAAELGLPELFVLYVGAITQLKNIDGLVRAFTAWRNKRPDIDLVVVGRESWPRYRRNPLDGIKGVRHFANLPDQVVAKLYAACTAVISLSWCEGFGLPIAEAMSWAKPVVVSDRGALPEIVGDAGLVVDPSKPEHAGLMVADMLDDPALLENLAARSRARSHIFSWKRAAQDILISLGGLVGGTAPTQ